MVRDYRKTLYACYLGFVSQAIAANFLPLLFLKFHNDYGIPLGKIALISTVFFCTQLVTDVLCARFVDKIGYRICAVLANLCFFAGFAGLAFLPELFSDPFTGIMTSVVVYAIASGILEVLGSPIVEACPFDHKETVMSLLHSFYCWGSVGVVLVSTAFFAVFGIDNWKWLALLWSLISLYNTYNFATCPIETLVEEGKGMGIRELLRMPMLWLAIALMVCAGSSELTMAQWASSYAESAIGLSKTMGDLAGPCLFAVSMGICRVLYGKHGDRIALEDCMLASGLLCLACYLMAALSTVPVVGLIGCITCGFSVGIMWPGTISISSKQIPCGGTAMFALLAMAGDLGGAFGPGVAGLVTQACGDNLQKGMLVGSVFPMVLVACVLILRRSKKG